MSTVKWILKKSPVNNDFSLIWPTAINGKYTMIIFNKFVRDQLIKTCKKKIRLEFSKATKGNLFTTPAKLRNSPSLKVIDKPRYNTAFSLASGLIFFLYSSQFTKAGRTST